MVSDCDAVSDIFADHHYVKTLPEAAAIVVQRGMDNECIDFVDKINDDHDYRQYFDAVKQGFLKESEMDAAAGSSVYGAHPAGHVRSAGDCSLFARSTRKNWTAQSIARWRARSPTSRWCC